MATTEFYTLSLHDALPIFPGAERCVRDGEGDREQHEARGPGAHVDADGRRSSCCSRPPSRSEEHTSELQSRENLVCRLLLEKHKLLQRSLPPPIQSRRTNS